MKQGKEKIRNESKVGIYVLAASLVLILIVIGILTVLIISLPQNKENQLVWSEEDTAKEQKGTEKQKGTEEQNRDTQEDIEERKEDAGEEEAAAGIFITAPADYMSLRSSPGLGEDVIEELPAGLYLFWDGEAVTEQEREFYKVKVEKSGNTGYVSADYCIPVEYRYDETVLSIVDTSKALYTYDEMQEDIDVLCSTYADCLSYEVIGYSVDGRELYALTLGSPEAEYHIFVQAAIHGREYMTAQLVMKMTEYYAANYENGIYQGKTYRELFEKTAIHIIPMSNPDGVTISQLGVGAMNHGEVTGRVYDCYLRDMESLVWEEDSNGDMNWADYYQEEDFDRYEQENPEMITFEEYQKIWKSNANGVDLNNNFDAGWADIDLKPYPSYGSYKGEYAVSETETQALVNEALRREYACFISYHSKGQLIYYDVEGNDEQTSERSFELASVLENLIKYKPVNTQKGYHVNLGGFSDWIQLDLQKASVTIENGKHPCPLAIEEFNAIWFRNRESWAMLCAGLY